MQLTLTALLLPIFNKSLSHKAVGNLHNAAADLFNRHILLVHVNGIDFKLKIWRRLSSFYCFVVVRSCILLLTMHNLWRTFEGCLVKLIQDVVGCFSFLHCFDWQSLPIKYTDLEWDFACEANRNEMTKQNVLIVPISLAWKMYTHLLVLSHCS